MPHRCAFGCKNITGIVLHSFPNHEKFPDRFQVWVNLVGGKLETELDYELYKKKKICDTHFTDEHRNRFKRLNALAVPTLNLPSISDNITAGVHILDITREHESVTSTIVVPQVLDPSTSVGVNLSTAYWLEKLNSVEMMRTNLKKAVINYYNKYKNYRL